MFFPNPVAQLQDQSLTDQKDADYAALQPAYRNVTLTDLDGSGTLTGAWAQVVSETGVPARSATDTFTYHRNDDRFEQVMAYYWVTSAQAANVTNIVAPTPDPACVADWDSVSYTSTVPHCLRRVGHEPALPHRSERRGVHHDGPRALWTSAPPCVTSRRTRSSSRDSSTSPARR